MNSKFTLYIIISTFLFELATTFSLTNNIFSLPQQWITRTSPQNRNKNSKLVPPKNVKIIILPGFFNSQEDYTMSGSLVSSLISRGWESSQIYVLPVERTDWLRVFYKGALDILFWKGVAPPTRPAYRWYLDLVVEEVQKIKQQQQQQSFDESNDDSVKGSDDLQIILMGHSAGGWLARAALGFYTEKEEEEDKPDSPTNTKLNLKDICALVTLGSPQFASPSMDMTRGALTITNQKFPGTYHSPKIQYISVAGTAIQGEKQIRQSPFEPPTIEGNAYESYFVTCGEGATVGDGVVPLCSAHLEDAIQITLDDAFHSINYPSSWYGSDRMIDGWHTVLLDTLSSQSLNSANREKTGLFDFPLFSRKP